MSDPLYSLWLASTLTADAAAKYVDCFDSIEELYRARESDYKCVPNARDSEIRSLSRKNLTKAQTILDYCNQNNICIMGRDDERYPDRLSYIYNPPIVLYLKGAIPNFDELASIAIVGTRKATKYGLNCTTTIAREISLHGGVVITGLAAGIDGAAAKAALRADGYVIGVLGTGVDVVYPTGSEELHEAVTNSGVLVSEFPPGTAPLGMNFPRRNRIISALSLGVLIVEAPVRSGSLITAALAQEQGRDVYVVPGNIDIPTFCGSNGLLIDGAQLITCGWDILSKYAWRFEGMIPKPERLKNTGTRSEANTPQTDRRTTNSAKKTVDNRMTEEYIDLKEQFPISEDEKVILNLLAGKSLTVDQIINGSGMKTETVLSMLTFLELKDCIKTTDDNHFVLT